MQIDLSTEHISTLAEDASGYPPAAYFAMELVRVYGASTVLAERDRIISFRANPFVQYLRALSPNKNQQWLLRMLAANSPLPPEILLELSSRPSDECGGNLMELVDVSLVVPDDSGWYRISDPVAEAVSREYPACTADEFAAIADAVGEYLDQSTADGAYLELSRVRFRALMLAGRPRATQEALFLAADWIRLAERFYHDQDYGSAAQAASAAVEARPKNADALMWLVKANIKLEAFPDAKDGIEALSRIGAVKEAAYLEGFLQRHRGRLREATEHYRVALRHGMHGVAIHRELALCYFGIGNLAEARRHIDDAQRRQRDNPYIIDLMIKIACAQADETTARSLLRVLETVDRPAFVAHRKSRVEGLFGDPEVAYREAKRAIDGMQRPHFHILTQLIWCEIRTRRHDDAQRNINLLEALYPNQRHDIKVGLRCRAAIERGAYRDALGFWEQLSEKDRPIHLKLRKDALDGLLQHTFVRDEERASYEADLAHLAERIYDAKISDFELMQDVTFDEEAPG
jgi:tetratricopeptide (TPR) repeat protein